MQLPGIRLTSFSQADAYTRRFPFFFKVALPRGVLDLIYDLPPKDTFLLSLAANIIVRKDLYLALASLLLRLSPRSMARAVFSSGPANSRPTRIRTLL